MIMSLNDVNLVISALKPKLVILQQIQFPALDIRLSYNDIQLFLAIAKSIPMASTPSPSDPDTTAAPSTERSVTPKDTFRQKTEALIGV